MRKLLVLLITSLAFSQEFSISFGEVDEVFEGGVMEIIMTNTLPVGGFQLEFSGIDIDSVSGGLAAESEFILNNSSSVVMGYSLDGTTILSDSEPLVYLNGSFAGQTVCFENVILSSSQGEPYDTEVGECWISENILGCTDIDGCNYNPEATMDDGSCFYMEDNGWCDCDGSVEDCTGECGGDTFFDGCGECGGDNSSCSGCTDPEADNYDPEATIDDHSCEYPSYDRILVINEINYNPALIFDQEDADYEFIELYNNGNDSIDLNEWNISSDSGIDFTFEEYILEPGEYVVLARNVDTYPGSVGYGNLDLSNSGETITLTDSNGQLADVVTYSDGFQGDDDQWPPEADAEGATLELINVNLDNNIPESWQASYVIPGGTPGYENSSEPPEEGCTDADACNYDPDAILDDGSCEYPEDYYDCEGNCLEDTDSDGVCNQFDQCPGEDDIPDLDGDGIPDCLDPTYCSDPEDPYYGENEDCYCNWNLDINTLTCYYINPYIIEPYDDLVGCENEYQPPSLSEIDQFRCHLQEFLYDPDLYVSSNGNISGCPDATLSDLGYEIKQYGGYIIFFESVNQLTSDTFERGWGTYVYNPDADKENYIIEVNHPDADISTEWIGPNVFVDIDAAWLLVAGAHRYACTEGQECVEDENCGADTAREQFSVFQMFHEEISNHFYGDVHSFSIHGFDENYYDTQIVTTMGTGETGIVLSHGNDPNNEFVEPSFLADMLVGQFNTQILDATNNYIQPAVFVTQALGFNYSTFLQLGATQNPQGTFTNTAYAQIGPRWIHIEADNHIRQDYRDEYYIAISNAVSDFYYSSNLNNYGCGIGQYSTGGCDLLYCDGTENSEMEYQNDTGDPGNATCQCEVGVTFDGCGICGGDNSSCADCAGVPNGNSEVDECETCDSDPSNDCVEDCAGEWGGDTVFDECNVCGGDNPNDVCGAEIREIYDVEEDQGGRVYIEFDKSFYDTDSLRNEFYSIERLREEDSVWVNVMSGTAYAQDIYVYEVSTLQNNSNETFRVISTMDEGVWASELHDGSSEDNIAPEQPQGLNYQVNNGTTIQLDWDAVLVDDLLEYAVYRSVDDEFTLDEILVWVDQNSYDDQNVDRGYFYSVSAFDLNGNEGPQSETIEVSSELLTNDAFIPTEFALRECYPNPFNPVTNVYFEVPSLSKVLLEVYNINGNYISNLSENYYQPGHHSVTWDARGQASGVYIIKMSSDGFSQSQKVMLIK